MVLNLASGLAPEGATGSPARRRGGTKHPCILFVHPNFPGQFVHVARHLAAKGWLVCALGDHTARDLPGVTLERYEAPVRAVRVDSQVARRFAVEAARGSAAADAARRLASAGFRPRVVVGHPGWGDMMYLKDVFPAATFIDYLEFWFSAEGADVGFDPEFGVPSIEQSERVRARNAAVLLAAADADRLVSPMPWQAQRFPALLRERITVAHEGIDTEKARPHAGVVLDVEGAAALARTGDEILTFVSRDLEPYRGFHVFMRSLPKILKARPNARVLVIGGDGVSYGHRPATGGSWRQAMMAEVGRDIDRSRVHFLGKVPHDVFIAAMQVSRVHVYLTYPFVLSWSVLEAMSCGALVVGSDTAPVRDVIRHGENGLLVDFFDTAALADTVCEALAAPEARFASLRRAARQSIVLAHDLRTVALPAWEKLITSAITEPSVHSSIFDANSFGNASAELT